jgi:hypothetical protein
MKKVSFRGTIFLEKQNKKKILMLLTELAHLVVDFTLLLRLKMGTPLINSVGARGLRVSMIKSVYFPLENIKNK